MNRKTAFDLTFVLGFAGFLSVLLTLCTPLAKACWFGELLPGLVFGTAISVCLLLYKVIHGFWKALLVPIAVQIAGAISALIGVYIEYFSPFVVVRSPQEGFSKVSVLALFVGGSVGAFLLLSTILVIVNWADVWKRVFSIALPWSLLGGVLGIIGWNLAPWLGVALWSLQYKLRVTGANDTFEAAVGQGRAGISSLMLVWQTGLGILLGRILSMQEPEVGNSVQMESHNEESSSLGN